MHTTVRGFKDILHPQSYVMTIVENTARNIFELYNFKEIRIPTVEYYELFIKSTGETTDIVEKEMYKFEDQSKRLIALRPEGTPSVIRAYINNNLNLKGDSTKFFYIGNMFRAEKPQAGRFREFEQIGAENIGDPTPFADAEAILMLDRILKELNIKSYTIEINSIGCDECRKKYIDVLISYLKNIDLCEICQKRLNRNPLRVLDCKTDKEKFKNLPKIEPCPDCKKHYEKVKELIGKETNFIENPLLVRGLDYYTRTVFEFKTNLLGSQDAIAAGGRYDNLVKNMGGPHSPSVGWAMGVERIVLLMEKNEFKYSEKSLCFVILQNEIYSSKAFEIALLLRKNGIRTDFNFSSSMKSQFRKANSNNAKIAVIIGEEEVKEKRLTLKNLLSGEQFSVKEENLIDKIKEIL